MPIVGEADGGGPGWIMKLLPLFLGGFAAGLAVCWAYIGSLKATLKLYETYIHERIDTLSKDGQSERPAPTCSQTPTSTLAEHANRNR